MYNMGTRVSKHSLFQYTTVLFLLLAFGYSFARAYLLSMTHDEALTYMHFAYLANTYSEVITYRVPTSNNHLLNSILIKFFTEHFGNSEIIVRLPSLIGLSLFLVGAFLTLKLFLKRSLLLIGTCFIIFHPFLIDYFSCARGYSLGLGFMSLALYFTFRRLERGFLVRESKNVALLFMMLTLAVLSNLSFLNVLLPAVCFFLILEVTRFIRAPEPMSTKLLTSTRNTALPILMSAIVLMIVYTKPIIKLRQAAEFYHGGTIGFWQNTVQTILDATVHGKSSPIFNPMPFLNILVIGMMTATLSYLIYQLIKKRSPDSITRYLTFVFALLVLGALGMILQHYLLDIVFPIDRAAIYFIPLLSVLLLLLWRKSETIPHALLKRGTQCFFYALTIVGLLPFANCANLTYFYLNQPDVHTKEMMLKIKSMTAGKNLPLRSVKLGVHWWFEPATNYYIIKERMAWIDFVDRNGPVGPFDFFYLRSENKHLIDQYGLKVLEHYEFTDTYFAVQPNSRFL